MIIKKNIQANLILSIDSKMSTNKHWNSYISFSRGDIHGESTEEAHRFFMENYRQIFPGRKPLPSIPMGKPDGDDGAHITSKSSSNMSTGMY